jgi:hypothetical protein
MRLAGMHREVLTWRHAEADFALARAWTLPGGHKRPPVLMDFSEGAIATATYAGQPVDARGIEDWTCHAGLPEYRGLNAPAGEAVLALLAEDDPWFTAPALLDFLDAVVAAGHARNR